MIGDNELTIEYAVMFLESLYFMGKIARVNRSQQEDVITVLVETWQGKKLGAVGQIGHESPWVQRAIRAVLTEVVMDDLGMFPPEGAI
jgi:hypothetical protein